MTNFGTFEDLVLMAPEELRAILIRLKDIIFSVDENACEVVRLGDKAASYGFGPKKMSECYCYIMPHTNWVNLGFYKGADIADPSGLLEGTGAKLRHIKIRSLDQCENEQIIQLIKAAIQERKLALGINKL
ncbi:MAG: DUF1801 domain-containing protein [Rhizobiaceae bacterium]|nr:DUF1801 domain-containing protein [Rhizobiaceae bacterium]